MIIQELKTAFPIYKNRERQHRFRRNCGGSVLFGLITPNDRLLPWQFRVETTSAFTISGWQLFNVCSDGSVVAGQTITDEGGSPITDEGGSPLTTEPTTSSLAYDLTGSIGSIEIVDHEGGKNVIYKGATLPTIDCGFYEMKVTLSDGQTYYSEIIHVVEYSAAEMPFLMLNWWNPADLANIVYSSGFENVVYLDSFVGHSVPSLTEEVVKDGLNVERVVAAVSTDRFVISEIVPDFLKTAIAAAPVCRNIHLFDPVSLAEFDATRLRVTTQPEGNGCNSFVEMQFEVDNELFRTACE